MVVVEKVMEEVVTCTHKEVVEKEKEVVETCIDTVVEVENCKHKHLLRLNLHCLQQREQSMPLPIEAKDDPLGGRH